MRLFALALLLAACGDDPPPEAHDVVGCGEAWAQNGYTECEYACEDAATGLTADGPSCEASSDLGPVSCQATFEHAGIQGCCATMKPKVLFAECDE